MPVGLYRAVKSLACEPRQPWLERTSARVVEDERGVNAVWVREF